MSCFEKSLLLVICMCPLDRATGCPDHWLNTILEYVCESAFGRNRLWLDGVKQMSPPVWVGFIQPAKDLNTTKSHVKAEFADCLGWNVTVLLPLELLSFRLLHSACHLSWFSGLWTVPLAFLGLQRREGRSWGFSASVIVWADVSHKSLPLCIWISVYIHISPIGFVSLENPHNTPQALLFF